MAVYKDIRGQDSVISQLKKTVETGQISHAYIFNGARGTGKKTAASIFARALLCEAGGSEPCDRCPSCRQALAGGNPDIKELVHEKANIVVDDIREQINDITVRIQSFLSHTYELFRCAFVEYLF